MTRRNPKIPGNKNHREKAFRSQSASEDRDDAAIKNPTERAKNTQALKNTAAGRLQAWVIFRFNPACMTVQQPRMSGIKRGRYSRMDASITSIGSYLISTMWQVVGHLCSFAAGVVKLWPSRFVQKAFALWCELSILNVRSAPLNDTHSPSSETPFST